MTAIIFDFDGTLADTEGLLLRSIEHVLGDLSEEDIQAYKYMTDKEFIEYLGISSLRAMYYYKKGKSFFEKNSEEIQLFPHIKALLKNLSHDYVIGVLSKNKKQIIKPILEREGVLDSISFIDNTSFLTSKEGKLKEFKSQYDDVVYVGDQVEDVESCKTSNCVCVAVTWGHHSKEFLEEVHPDKTVSSVTALKKVLYSLCGRSSSSTSQDST